MGAPRSRRWNPDAAPTRARTARATRPRPALASVQGTAAQGEGDPASRGGAGRGGERGREGRLDPADGDRGRGRTDAQRDSREGGRGGDAASDQPAAEPLAGAGLAALDRADRPAEVAGRLLVGQALEVAEDQGRPIRAGEAIDLLVDQEDHPVVPRRLDRAGGRRLRVPALVMPTPRIGDPQAGRGPHGDGVEPGPERVADPEGLRPQCQRQEDGLEGILDVVLVAERGPAGAPDHRPVALEQGLERRGRLPPRRSRPAHRSRSWASVSPATAPPAKAERIWRRAALSEPLGTGRAPGVIAAMSRVIHRGMTPVPSFPRKCVGA